MEEVRSAFRNQEMPIFLRIIDKDSGEFKMTLFLFYVSFQRCVNLFLLYNILPSTLRMELEQWPSYISDHSTPTKYGRLSIGIT